MSQKAGIYEKYIKRMLDFVLSLMALIVLLPILILLVIIGAVKMKGNPFFTQMRPGKDEKIFKLIKFRTMTNEKDSEGNLLSDDVRLTKYGRFLRSTSLDELPELINILKGDMSIVGPRPLVPQYLSYYNDNERKRHNVRPGLTGMAQINGRNSLDWDTKFTYDVQYVTEISFILDCRIIWKTVAIVFKRDSIGTRGHEGLIDFDEYRKLQNKVENVL